MPPTLHPGAIQGKEEINFCHLATLQRLRWFQARGVSLALASQARWMRINCDHRPTALATSERTKVSLPLKSSQIYLTQVIKIEFEPSFIGLVNNYHRKCDLNQENDSTKLAEIGNLRTSRRRRSITHLGLSPHVGSPRGAILQ